MCARVGIVTDLEPNSAAKRSVSAATTTWRAPFHAT
jgi:hypothetical protein